MLWLSSLHFNEATVPDENGVRRLCDLRTLIMGALMVIPGLFLAYSFGF